MKVWYVSNYSEANKVSAEKVLKHFIPTVINTHLEDFRVKLFSTLAHAPRARARLSNQEIGLNIWRKYVTRNVEKNLMKSVEILKNDR